MEAFEMWCYRRMMNIKWMDRITNEKVLGRIEEKRTLWKSLKKRRGQMMGHTLRHGGLLRDILEGEVGKKPFMLLFPVKPLDFCFWHFSNKSG